MSVTAADPHRTRRTCAGRRATPDARLDTAARQHVDGRIVLGDPHRVEIDAERDFVDRRNVFVRSAIAARTTGGDDTM